MDSDYIKQFLSEESLEALDASKGAQILFVQIPKYDELKEKHDEGIAKFSECDNMIHQKKKELKEIDEKGFFSWVFGFAKLRKQKKEIEREIAEIDADITKILQETGVYYHEMTPIRKEIDDFRKTLRMFGLDLDDVKNEYFRIRMMLEREKRQAESGIKTESKTEQKAGQKLDKIEPAESHLQTENAEEKSQNQPN